MKYIELSVVAHPEAVDAVANVFRENGDLDVSIEQPFSGDDDGENPPTFIGSPVIRAYLPMTGSSAALEQRIREGLWHLQAFNLSPIGEIERREVDEEDWANSWKEHFHPLKIGRVVIKPSWREWEPQGDELVVEIDPGMAFGTGLHPTTQLTLLAVQKYVRSGMKVLDLGTGSGILAIAAALLGAHIVAVDISEVAVEVAARNAELNGLRDRIDVRLGSIETVTEEKFDCILANIIASVLADLAPNLADAARPGAHILASGIIEERAGIVRDAFGAAGLQLVDEQCEGDWWLLVANRAT